MNKFLQYVITMTAFVTVGCERYTNQQLAEAIVDGKGIQYRADRLGRIRTYGYDASMLRGRLASYVEHANESLVQLPLFYLIALKFESDPLYDGTKGRTCFRFQYSGVFKHLGEGSHSPNSCFTFFMKSHDGATHVLCVDMNCLEIHHSTICGDRFDFSSGYSPINVWSGDLPYRDHPESILTARYTDILAVRTDRPFNYHAHRKEFFEGMQSPDVYRVCWRTPDCMIFLPTILMDHDVSLADVSRLNPSDVFPCVTTSQLYDFLSTCRKKQDVAPTFCKCFGSMNFNLRGIDHYTKNVLFDFQPNRNMKNLKNVALVLAQIMYYVRILSNDSSLEQYPIPPNICVIDKDEAVFAETKEFVRFYMATDKRYDWDRPPLKPCPNLVEDILATLLSKPLDIFDLTNRIDVEKFVGRCTKKQ